MLIGVYYGRDFREGSINNLNKRSPKVKREDDKNGRGVIN